MMDHDTIWWPAVGEDGVWRQRDEVQAPPWDGVWRYDGEDEFDADDDDAEEE